jgi:hypothetical protein
MTRQPKPGSNQVGATQVIVTKVRWPPARMGVAYPGDAAGEEVLARDGGAQASLRTRGAAHGTTA